MSSYTAHPHLHSFPTRRSSDLAKRRRDKRHRLLQATEDSLRKLVAEVGRRTNKPLTAVQIGLKAGKVNLEDRKSTRLNSSHVSISYAVFCLKKKTKKKKNQYKS